MLSITGSTKEMFPRDKSCQHHIQYVGLFKRSHHTLYIDIGAIEGEMINSSLM